MNNDSLLIFEAYRFKRITEDAVESEDLPTRSHEIIAAIMPKDININGKKNENEFFNKAFPYVAKIIFDGNERRAQRYMYYDEDFNSDLISTYSYYQKHGFPKLREQDVERINRKMHGSVEEKPQQYAKDMEKDYTSQKISGENAEGSALGAFTVVSGGVDNTSDVGFDISEIYPVNARNLKNAAHIIMKDMTHEDRDFGTNFPHKYRQFKKDIFIMSNDNGDFVAVLPGDLSEDQIFDKLVSVRDASEEAEHSVSPGFHYDPSHHLMQAANQINKILQSNSDDEATPEHIEQMALKILGPQSEYRDYHEFNLALKGVIALLNRYIVVSMNEGEESGMPTKQFMSLKQHINKGPIKVKKPTKELPYTHKYINQLAKQDPREGHKEEDEERRLDPKCWKGYHKQGTKMKGGKRVNNCVKNEQEEGDYSNVAHDYAERIVGADVDDPKALAKHYLDNPSDVPEPLQHDVLKQNFGKILKYIDFTVGLNQRRKKEEEYKKKELAKGPVHPDPEIGLPGSKQARYKPQYKYNPADYLPRQ